MLHLERHRFTLIPTSDLSFPPTDQGFQGSAWHGRLDDALRANGEHYRLLAPTVKRYWIDSPLDRDATGSSAFNLSLHRAGEAMGIALYCAGDALVGDSAMADYVAKCVRQAGREPRKGFWGTYTVAAHVREVFPFARIAALPVSSVDALSDLRVDFLSMLRIDDGQCIEYARQGLVPLPHFHHLCKLLLVRVRALALSEHEVFLSWLDSCEAHLRSAKDVLPVSNALAVFDAERLSGKRHERLPIGGLLGNVVYRGSTSVLDRFRALLLLGEWVRIGRKTNLGLGRIAVGDVVSAT